MLGRAALCDGAAVLCNDDEGVFVKRTVKTGPKRRRYKNRDGNEKVRKGVGCTNRSYKLDWLPGGKTWGDVKLARQAPIMEDN